MKLVLLLRHGKSDWSTEVDDRERPLAKRGRNAAQRWASSSPERASRPTRSWGRRPARGRAPRRWPSCRRMAVTGANERSAVRRGRVDDARRRARRGGYVARPMLVGHEPASSEAVALLVDGETSVFPTAAVAGIELDIERWADVEPGRGRLVYLVPPRLLRANEGSTSPAGLDAPVGLVNGGARGHAAG